MRVIAVIPGGRVDGLRAEPDQVHHHELPAVVVLDGRAECVEEVLVDGCTLTLRVPLHVLHNRVRLGGGQRPASAAIPDQEHDKGQRERHETSKRQREKHLDGSLKRRGVG